MSIKVGDKVTVKTNYPASDLHGKRGEVTLVSSGIVYPITAEIDGQVHFFNRNELHTFQDTLDEMERVSAANNEEPDSLEEREHAAIVTLLNDAYAGDFNGVDADRVIEYIDKLRRNQ